MRCPTLQVVARLPFRADVRSATVALIACSALVFSCRKNVHSVSNSESESRAADEGRGHGDKKKPIVFDEAAIRRWTAGSYGPRVSNWAVSGHISSEEVEIGTSLARDVLFDVFPVDVVLKQCDRGRIPYAQYTNVVLPEGEERYGLSFSWIFDRSFGESEIAVIVYRDDKPSLARRTYEQHCEPWAMEGDPIIYSSKGDDEKGIPECSVFLQKCLNGKRYSYIISICFCSVFIEIQLNWYLPSEAESISPKVVELAINTCARLGQSLRGGCVGLVLEAMRSR